MKTGAIDSTRTFGRTSSNVAVESEFMLVDIEVQLARPSCIFLGREVV
jgi:glutamine synthetase type III